MQMIAIARWIKQQALSWNLFDSPESREDAVQLRIAIVSTRFYTSLLTLVIINLITYTSLAALTETITIEKPSQIAYTVLHEKYPDSLSCPCKNIAIRYEDFIKISIRYHPICASLFISDVWISELFVSNLNAFVWNDFRITAGNYFQLIDAFCTVARRSVKSSIDDLSSKVLLTKHLLSSTSLSTKSRDEISFALNATGNRMQQHNAFIRKAFHSNQFQTIFKTPRTIEYFSAGPGSILSDNLYFFPRIIDTSENTSCTCADQSTCSTTASYFSADGVM